MTGCPLACQHGESVPPTATETLEHLFSLLRGFLSTAGSSSTVLLDGGISTWLSTSSPIAYYQAQLVL